MCVLQFKKMYVTALVVLFIAAPPALGQEDGPPMGYHQLIGIPAAERIKAREDHIHLKDTARLYKGEKISIEHRRNYPFYGGLIIKLLNQSTSNCGSSLLNSNRLVTAAHCWVDGHSVALSMTVVLGSVFLYYGGTRIETEQFVTHPWFNLNTFENDIAIIYLPYNVIFTDTIFPIALPEGWERTHTFWSQYATAVGAGLTEKLNEDYADGPTLRRSVLQIISNDECRNEFFARTPDQLCTNGKGNVGPCFGDSGGPLYMYTDRKFLIGIVSHGSPECSVVGTPTAYTRVADHFAFIESHATLPKFTFHFEKKNGLLLENITVLISDETQKLQQFTHFSSSSIK